MKCYHHIFPNLTFENFNRLEVTCEEKNVTVTVAHITTQPIYIIIDVVQPKIPPSILLSGTHRKNYYFVGIGPIRDVELTCTF